MTQINVIPEYRRHLVAGQLLQAQFDRSAYGCRLYCCWCAQDLAANAFWESMGFTAIAFRTGSMTKGRKKTPRVHIFWQKRIRSGDVSTPWWYPSTTGGGEMREDRLVFPILPGVSWREVGPVTVGAAGSAEGEAPAALPPAEAPVAGGKAAPRVPRAAGPRPAPAKPVGIQRQRPFWITEPAKPVAKPPAVKKPKSKIDPKLLAMTRQLRDQWAERADTIVEASAAKHDVRRIAPAPAAAPLRLDAA